MNLSSLLGLGVVGLFLLLILLFVFLGRRKQPSMRVIPAFSRLVRAIGLAVEDGSRLHISVGRGELTDPSSTASFVGLSMLDRITQVASESDNPPVATVGNGALVILTQDTLRKAYQEIGAGRRYNPKAGQLTGLTPFSYAAGVIPAIKDESVSSSVLAGNFGSEVALITDAAERSERFVLAGTDNIVAQSILYSTAEEPLIGEELFAGGAYLGAGNVHEASLRAQDLVRWLLVVAIVAGSIIKLLGL